MDSADVNAVNLALLAFRCAVGVVFLAHGINHIFRGGKIKGTAGWFESLGMKPGVLHAWTASLVEVAAGAMLVLGLGMPLAGAGVIGTMVVALVTNHMKNGFFIFRPGEGYEYVLTLTVVAVCLAMLGAGEWSLDDALELDAMNGWSGLLMAAVAGGGGTAVLLAVFWRPEKPAEA